MGRGGANSVKFGKIELFSDTASVAELKVVLTEILEECGYPEQETDIDADAPRSEKQEMTLRGSAGAEGGEADAGSEEPSPNSSGNDEHGEREDSEDEQQEGEGEENDLPEVEDEDADGMRDGLIEDEMDSRPSDPVRGVLAWAASKSGSKPPWMVPRGEKDGPAN